jgi:hypothetical protein
MCNCSRYIANKLALSCMAVLGLFLLTTEVQAQEENARKPFEKQSVEEHNLPSEGGLSVSAAPTKPAAAKSILPVLPTKKEVHSGAHLQEKESKKNESPSTLSFNIFLYIVDKFKQDLY